MVNTQLDVLLDQPISLRAKLEEAEAKPLYILPTDPVVKEVLIPAMLSTKSVDIMMGYFSSSSFAEIAPGLASYLRRSVNPIRLVISPFLTNSDFDAVTRGPDYIKEIANKIFIRDIPDEDSLSRHSLECLAWLIDRGRLEIKIAVMRDSLFHSKVWLFKDGPIKVALHGSMNFTNRALTKNKEQLTLSRNWKGEDAIYQIDRLEDEFKNLWSGGDKDCYVLELPDAVQRDILKKYRRDTEPAESKFEDIWNKAHNLETTHEIENIHDTRELKVPSYLQYETGEFSHQGDAVKAWFNANRRGILEMATGAGKTITSMICATKLQNSEQNILVVVAAPYRPLIEQWCEEIKEFGITAINLTNAGGPSNRDREIKQAARRLKMNLSRCEILVVSNDTLCTEAFISSIAAYSGKKLLIADECHNLGAASFIKNPPKLFDFRLGLSATPVRQYDQDGTNSLISFFGDICFSFTLEQAIGKCLTPYDYHVHLVELTDNEMTKWYEITDKIKEMSWQFARGELDPYLDSLLRQRRLLLETAQHKIGILDALLEQEGPQNLKYTLIYATDKDPTQLENVNATLSKRNVLFRQLTAEETTNRDFTKLVLSEFQNGTFQVLTAKRVLDEGINIPQIKLAYILASTTVKRQWVQRRGRLLRTCKEIGKTHAVIHDFVVLPPGTSQGNGKHLDADARKLVRSELDRVWEFARLSRNGPQSGGPYKAVSLLQKLANEEVYPDGI